MLIAAGAAAADDPHPQHDVTATSHRKTIQATRGTHCTPTRDGMVCADYAYPLETGKRLPIHPRGRIVLEFKTGPEEVDAQLRNRRSAPVFELVTKGRGKKRKIRLPRELPKGSDRLGFFVAYERGDADFEVDLKRHRHG
jgi:hypothetical protein